jgi:hypothetical protein
MEVHSDRPCTLSFRSSRLTAICIASNPVNDGVFADLSLGKNYPEALYNPDVFNDFASLNGNHSHLPVIIFPFSRWMIFILFLRGFRYFLCPVSNFQRSVLLILSVSSLSYNFNIAIRHVRMQHFFTLDCFTLLVVLPKNKIRSIINSFIY